MQDGLFEFLRRVPLWLHHQWRRNAHKMPDLEGRWGEQLGPGYDEMGSIKDIY
jgi:hypothetical protein